MCQIRFQSQIVVHSLLSHAKQTNILVTQHILRKPKYFKKL